MTQDFPSWAFLEYSRLSLSQSCHNMVLSLLWPVLVPWMVQELGLGSPTPGPGPGGSLNTCGMNRLVGSFLFSFILGYS